MGAGGPVGGPCGVLYGKNQRRGRRRVRRRRIFIQPPEMVERQLGVAFLMRSIHHVWALRNQHFIIQNLLALLYHVR